ncbi:MAG TPA: META domain-containing protein, partial [Caldilineaceae bacterium]|nr:META domain-containing protein [Caldilineaceae bacterium]
IYQGFTNDGQYLVLFFYPPVTTTALPNTVADVPQSEFDQVNSDPTSYLAAKAAELNALPSDAWEPDLAVLDALVSSLTISNMPQNGIEGKVWQWVGRYNAGEETPLENTATYTVSFLPNNQFAFTADCNSGSGVYEADGGMVGSLRTTLSPATPAACGPDSLSNELIGAVQSAQNYKVRPAGQLMELVRPAGGGSLLFAPVALAAGATTAPTTTLQSLVTFTTTASVIDQGQCATLRWEAENVRAVSIYPLVGTSANGPGSLEVCPEDSTTYELRAVLPDGSTAVRQVTITVNQPGG